MISQFMSSSPTLGSVLTAWSLEPISDSVSPTLSDPPHSHSVSLSQKETLKNKNKTAITKGVNTFTSCLVMEELAGSFQDREAGGDLSRFL